MLLKYAYMYMGHSAELVKTHYRNEIEIIIFIVVFKSIFFIYIINKFIFIYYTN